MRENLSVRFGIHHNQGLDRIGEKSKHSSRCEACRLEVVFRCTIHWSDTSVRIWRTSKVTRGYTVKEQLWVCAWMWHLQLGNRWRWKWHTGMCLREGSTGSVPPRCLWSTSSKKHTARSVRAVASALLRWNQDFYLRIMQEGLFTKKTQNSVKNSNRKYKNKIKLNKIRNNNDTQKASVTSMSLVKRYMDIVVLL